MTRYSNLINNINFEGFSRSSGWVGYFERKGDFSQQTVEDSIHIIQDFFDNQESELFVISCLSYDEKLTDDSNEINEMFNRLKSKYLIEMSPEYEDYLLGEKPLPASLLHFHPFSDDIYDLCRLLMSCDNIVGEVLFLINLNKSYIVYPHQDTGFGFIDLNDSHYCLNFLTNLANQQTNRDITICIQTD